MSDGTITLITEQDEVVSLPGVRENDTVLVDGAAFASATGWAMKPEGLCRGDVCLPASLWPAMSDGERVDLGVFAKAADRPVVIDSEHGIAAIGTSATQRREQLGSLEAPPFTASDLDGKPVSLDDFAGRKKVLVSFASWCGCRYDLPGWQELHEELEPHGLSMIAIAVDEEADDARPWVDEASATFPVVLDRDHVLCDTYDIRNVPTVMWIDENDRIVRPNDVAFGTDMFKDFHGVDSAPHHDALRRWVLDGELPLADDDAVHDHQVLPSEDEQLGRLHFRVAIELRRAGDAEAARSHFARAAELAPTDFTICRAAMPLLGIDPFLSDEFIALWEDFKGRGGYNYGFDHGPLP